MDQHSRPPEVILASFPKEGKDEVSNHPGGRALRG